MKASDDHDGDESPVSDGRRARLADLHRLESALAEAAGQLKAMQEFLGKRDETPMPKAQFYGLFFIVSAMTGRNAKYFRGWADAAWQTYIDALANKPKPSLEELYGAQVSEPATSPEVAS